MPKHLRQTSLGVLTDSPGWPGMYFWNSGHPSKFPCVVSEHTPHGMHPLTCNLGSPTIIFSLNILVEPCLLVSCVSCILIRTMSITVLFIIVLLIIVLLLIILSLSSLSDVGRKIVYSSLLVGWFFFFL